jgi:hypothetical protein
MKKEIRLRIHWRNEVVVDEWVNILPRTGDLIKFMHEGSMKVMSMGTPEWTFDKNGITVDMRCME